MHAPFRFPAVKTQRPYPGFAVAPAMTNGEVARHLARPRSDGYGGDGSLPGGLLLPGAGADGRSRQRCRSPNSRGKKIANRLDAA
jgi:hypothetical protein